MKFKDGYFNVCVSVVVMGCGSSLSRDVQPIKNTVVPVKNQVRVDKGDKVALSSNDNIVFVFGEHV